MGLDWGSGASGAATGAAIGSAIPGIGTAVGALGGGLLGLFGSKKKKPKKPKIYNTLDPQAQELYNDYVASIRGQGSMSGMFNYDPEAANINFDRNVSRPAYRNFQENVIPSITGQFRSGGIGNSTYTGEALSRHGRDIQESLNAARTNMHYQGMQQANQNKLNAINTALNTQTFAYGKPEARTPNGVDQILSALAPVAGNWFADYLKT